jgi:hypothetical protein
MTPNVTQGEEGLKSMEKVSLNNSNKNRTRTQKVNMQLNGNSHMIWLFCHYVIIQF